MSYLLLKAVHQGAVVLSVTGFVVRGLAAFGGAGWVRGRVARTLPHAIDTVLLGSAVSMAVIARWHPLEQPWLAAKLVALAVYIALGRVALAPSRPLHTRVAAWAAALATVAYIVSAALHKSALGFLS
ncbi:MAG: SirB2 family protein [Ideonella sp.]|nr:SirB2 family protein [Ideonella sp.]